MKRGGGGERVNHSLQTARQRAKTKKKLTSRSVVRMSEASRPLCVRGDADGGVFCKKNLKKKKNVNSNSLSESLTGPTVFFF
jgi:hypothetical protein